MGLPIRRDTFDEADYLAFAERLESNLEALRLLLDRPGFGVGPTTIGAELEMSLVDAAGEPLLLNEQILAALSHDAFTVEANRFNLESNSTPVALAGTPFARLAAELREHTGRARTEAAAHGGRVVLIGILPTLRPEHFAGGVMTDTPRFRAINAGLRRLKQGPFQVHIRGEDVLRIDVNDSTYEGANTSFQLHLRVDPADFADTHNAAQMATGLALAVAGNAPVFLGCRLWEETRIALFKQSVDDRDRLDRTIGRVPRVSFGLGWTEGGAYPLFEESVRHHAPILPVVGGEDPVVLARSGGLPRLAELRLHHGTIWRWNRAVYDPAGGGHLRIEFRALPT